MSKKRIILGYFVGFITSVTLFTLVLLLISKFTVSSKSYFVHKLESDNYYEKIYDEIREEMELHLLSTGFTNEILDNVYTKEEVIEDITLFINNMYEGKTTILDKSNVRYNIKINIDNFFKKTKLTVMNKDELNKFVDDLTKVYKDEICLYNFVDGYISSFNKINKIINIGSIISLIMFIGFSLLFILVIKADYYGSIITASGLIILFIRLFVFERVDVTDILIITEKFSVVLRVILANLQDIMLISGIVLIILGLVLQFIFSFTKTKKLKKNNIEKK